MTITPQSTAYSPERDVIMRLLDEFASDWTARQALAIEGALRGLQQEEIATLWTPRITQPSVAAHLRAGHWHAIDHALRVFESSFDPGKENA